MLDHVLRYFWPRSLLGRLIVVVVAIDGIAAFTVGGVIVFQARTATVIEMASAMTTAELLVTDTIGVMKEADASLLLQTIDLHSASVRHVRISVTDPVGQPVKATQSAGPVMTQADFASSPPDWFSRLIAPAREVKVIPVLLRNRLVGNVTVTSEPADEIGEAWHYARGLLQAGLVLSLVVLLLATLLFGRVLAPLGALVDGLKRLEDKDYKIRLPQPPLRDLAVIANHFNRTAEALDRANAANRQLNHQLVTAQDDERRRTALELHDEVGPCLFALNASASSIARLAGSLDSGGRLHERAEEVVALIRQVQGINRRVLDRLRPMGLGHFPLKECILKILVDFTDESGPSFGHKIGNLEDTYGRLVDLTVYRCVQEGLFNALRHAQATQIDLSIHETCSSRLARRIEIKISDDGRGWTGAPRLGTGLTGMRERLDAIGGTLDIRTSASGTELYVIIPAVPDEGGAGRLSQPLESIEA